MNARLAYVAGPLAFTGMQLVAPTFPLIASDLGLSNAELALVTSVYLLPAAVFALPAGFLADRWGRRAVMGWSLVLFGACGALYPIVSTNFALFLTVRFVQGLAFAAILPLTITILGDTYRGQALIKAQGYRSLSLGIGDAVLPVIGGLLAGVGWETAWLVQAVAVPFGVLVLFVMEDVRSAGSRRTLSRGKELTGLLRTPSVAALQWVGIQRMFVKFAILAFLPVFLVDIRGYSPGFAGLVLGVSSGTGVVVALFPARLTRHGSVAWWVGTSMVAGGVAIVGYVASPTSWVILVLAVMYGASDGITGVLSNALVAVATTGDLRASFVAATGALRNFAKFLAPTSFGALVLVMPVGVAFVVLGALGAAGSATARFLGPFERRLKGDEVMSG